MNLKNCKYMKTVEFKARQVWLPFVDAIGIALEIMSEIKEQTATWYKSWVKSFKSPRNIPQQTQLQFNFLAWLFLTVKEKS